MPAVSALESSQHSFWLKLVQPLNMPLEGVGEEAREEAGGREAGEEERNRVRVRDGSVWWWLCATLLVVVVPPPPRLTSW